MIANSWQCDSAWRLIHVLPRTQYDSMSPVSETERDFVLSSFLDFYFDRALSYHPQLPQAIWDPGINRPWSGNSQPWGHVHLGNCKVVAARFWESDRLELLHKPGPESKNDSIYIYIYIFFFLRLCVFKYIYIYLFIVAYIYIINVYIYIRMCAASVYVSVWNPVTNFPFWPMILSYYFYCQDFWF